MLPSSRKLGHCTSKPFGSTASAPFISTGNLLNQTTLQFLKALLPFLLRHLQFLLLSHILPPRPSPIPLPLPAAQPYCPATWHQIHDARGNNLGTSQFTVDLDKGFSFSPVDRAWVCQKKNHFQMSVKFAPLLQKFIRLPSGAMVAADNLTIGVQGLRVENRGLIVTIEQSRRPDRTRHPLRPLSVGKPTSHGTQKITVSRLHFSETTANNMRKKGKPNPNQRYFSLVITLAATVNGQSYPLCAVESERVVVRAANLNIFVENDVVQQQWVTAADPTSISYLGRVGINTNTPQEALAVHGNVQVSGVLLQPSDRRLKTDIAAIDSRQQLENIKRVRLYEYKLKDAWALAVGREASKSESGVLAQELQQILPDAVRETGQDVSLGKAGVLKNLLVVNKERLFLESVGAVKELGWLVAAHEKRLCAVERLSAAVVALALMLGVVTAFCAVLVHHWIYAGQQGGCMPLPANSSNPLL